MILKFPNRKAEVELDRSVLGQLFTQWKAAYGFAIHGNYQFSLGAEETQTRWDKAHDAERVFTSFLHDLFSLTKIQKRTWIHIIEARIDEAEKDRANELANNPAFDTSRLDSLLVCLKKTLEAITSTEE